MGKMSSIRMVSSEEWREVLKKLHRDPMIGAKSGRDLVAKDRWQHLPKGARKSGPSLGGVKRPPPVRISQEDIKLARSIRGQWEIVPPP
jgi:hypothetical protein